MAKQVGRRKRKNMTSLAIRVECKEECCGPCRMLDRIWDDSKKCEVLHCRFFTVELAPAFGDSHAERCSDCHMAERCGLGEFMD